MLPGKQVHIIVQVHLLRLDLQVQAVLDEMGYASAVGIILLAITMIINLIQLTLSGTFKKEE